MIAVTGLMFRRTPVFLLAFSLVILFCCYALQVRHQPYMSMSEREKVVKKYDADAHAAGRRQSTSKKKKVFKMGENKAGANLRVTSTLEYFWNYNSVESTLLFCACMIMLGGLMFGSEQVQPGSEWELGLVVVMFLILLFSLVYFFLVFMTEILIGLGALDNIKCLQKKTSTALEENESVSNPLQNDNADEIVYTNIAAKRHAKKHESDGKDAKTLVEKVNHAKATVQSLQQELKELKQQEQKAQAGQLNRYASSKSKSKRKVKLSEARQKL